MRDELGGGYTLIVWSVMAEQHSDEAASSGRQETSPETDSTVSESQPQHGCRETAGIVIITLVGVLVIAWVYWYFFSASGELSRLQRPPPPIAAAVC